MPRPRRKTTQQATVTAAMTSNTQVVERVAEPLDVIVPPPQQHVEDSSDLSDAPEIPDVPSSPKKRKTRSSQRAADSNVNADATPRPRRTAKKTKVTTALTLTEEVVVEPAPITEDTVEPSTPKPKPKRTRKRKADVETTEVVESTADVDVADVGGETVAEEPKPKKKRTMKPKPPIVYVIPDVERKETTFRGRLGYACLNTVLRNVRPAHESIFASRTCRIDTIEKSGMDYVKGLGLQNVRDLKKMIEWNEANNIRFMRMSSEIFPFASHDKYGYTLEFADEDLKAVGNLAKSLGHRLTLHPGQFTQIGSPNKKVVDASVRELEYHCEMMERMGLGPDGVMIIHMGGVFGDKAATIARFRENYTTRLNDRIKARLVLENDEICYNLDDIMPICDELNIPIVVDYHHDWINPSSRSLSTLIPLINKTWERKGIKPKQHLSEPRPGAESVMEKRAHADRCKSLPGSECLGDDMDLMIEAKDKEQAVFELHRIYNLAPVIHENLRPPNPNPTLATAGRKTSSPRKKKKVLEEEGEGEMDELDPEDLEV